MFVLLAIQDTKIKEQHQGDQSLPVSWVGAHSSISLMNSSIVPSCHPPDPHMIQQSVHAAQRKCKFQQPNSTRLSLIIITIHS
jgi:hypothetical protein